MIKAQLVIRDRVVFDDGAIQEIVIWQVPSPVHSSDHVFKYSLFYGYPGRRLVGYDNERGKGDHKHIDGKEAPYTFSSIEKLIDYFMADIDAIRGEET